MSILGINDATMQLRLPVGAPYNLRLRMQDGQGGHQDLTGRVFALTFFSGSTAPFSVTGVIGVDVTGSYAAFAVDGATSLALRGRLGLGWEVAELFTDGKVPLLLGQLFIAAAALEADGVPAIASSALDQVEWTPAGQVVVAVPVGSRGLSSAEQAFLAGLIDEPTAAALDARYMSAALASLAALQPTHGTAVGGETSIVAPAPVPADTPWWVSVFWNGSPQRPGVNFTSDGSAVIHLNFTLAPGDEWIVDQRQRSPDQ